MSLSPLPLSSSASSSSSSAPNNFWNKEEDEVLRQAVAEQDGEETINWHRIADKLPFRTNKDCRKRWVYSLQPTLQKGVWTEEENQLLQEGIRTHGRR